jgi:hypothetical protein
LQTSCLTDSALVKRGVQRLDLEELPDLDAPELVNVAQADGVRVCRVAELVRVNHDAKQTRVFVTKTRCLFGHCLLVRC